MKFELKQEVYDGLDGICFGAFDRQEKLPINEMMDELMHLEGLPVHCPYHHYIVPAAMLVQTAIQTGADRQTLEEWLAKAQERAKTVPAGFCGECGTCGAAVGIGIFVSVYTGATPMSIENWQWANEVTGKCLMRIASFPGPRCCKRTCYLALVEGVPYANEKCGLSLEVDPALVCEFSTRNPTCNKEGCPFCEENPRNQGEGFPITVPEQMMPKQDPERDCECMHRPVDITEHSGVIWWQKQDGAYVRRGELLAEGEIDKKTIEFFAETDGILIKELLDEEVFTYGTVLGYIRAK